MSLRVVALWVLAVLPLNALFGATAQAQLFSGWSNSSSAPPPQSRPLRMSRPAAGLFSARAIPGLRPLGRWSPASRSNQSHAGDQDAEWNGSYRTLCVRMCDGYYFPVSFRTTRGRMYHDAKICEASCDCETKLFYLPGSSNDIKHATDLSGQSYGRLDNAFEYRRVMDKSCTCRPVPWSEPEKMRHEQYAAFDAGLKAEVQARKAEALTALIEREDAKEAEATAARLALQEEKDRKDQARKVAAKVDVAAPAVAQVAGVAPPDVPAAAAPALEMAAAEAISDEPAAAPPSQADEAVVEALPEKPVEGGAKPPARKRSASASGRVAMPVNRANRPSRSAAIKFSRPQARGFMQM